uniref:Uncharacterized protein n=1 Tax=Anguilla anguilla TaxID=7936 RepID=A0A0E9QCZ2_ANGAN
MSFGQYCSYTS